MRLMLLEMLVRLMLLIELLRFPDNELLEIPPRLKEVVVEARAEPVIGRRRRR